MTKNAPPTTFGTNHETLIESKTPMNEIAAAISSLKAALDITKSFVALRDEASIQAKVIELQSTIIQAQQSAFLAQQERLELLEKTKEFEREIHRLKDWTAEKQKYRLVTPRDGVPLYELRVPDERPAHHLCSHCFDTGSKSTIVRAPKVKDSFHVHKCPKCSTEYQFEKYESSGVSILTFGDSYDPYRDF